MASLLLTKSFRLRINQLLGRTCDGIAYCHPHYGEFLQGAFEIDKGGRPGIVRALVSVHMPNEPGSAARFTLDPRRTGKFRPEAGRTGITVIPRHFVKSQIAARLMLDTLGLQNVGGTLEVMTSIPEGGGMGSSTTGVVASLRATAEAVSAYKGTRILPAPHLQARLAVAAEKACDSIMFDCTGTTVLFAHREGKVIKTFNGPLPRMTILGFDTATAGGVDTDKLPRARYSSEQIAGFGCALATLERAIAEQSVDLVGRVATFSAFVSETAWKNPLRKPRFADLIQIKDATGSAGVAVAHSGTVAGLIFEPALPDLERRLSAAGAAVKRLGFSRLRTFSTPY